MKLVAVLLTGVVMLMACGARSVFVAPEDIHEEQRVVLTLNDGSTISGLALRANSKSLLLMDESGEEHIVFVKNIVSAKGPEPIFDDNDCLISEAEIDSTKTNVNKSAYAIAGGVISLGVSYLAGTLVEREFMQESSGAAIYSGMAAGTLAGAALFAKTGAQKDREVAVEYVLESRMQAEEILSLPDNETDKLLKLKIAETIAQRELIDQDIEQILHEIEELDQLLENQKSEN